MKNIIKKYKEYTIAPIVVLIIGLLIYLLKGIYPFGTNTVASGDMGQSYVPFYYFLYDVCHGTKSLFFDFALGYGSNTYGGFIVDGLFNPTSYLVLLGSRENVPYMLSFVMIAKYMFIAVTSYILFKKINKKENFYNYLFAIMYSLSAYALAYNSNLMWLDIVGLFPLFILATKYMFDKGKIYYFSIVLALILIFNYNLAYMILMFIIFIIPIYIHYGLPKEERKKATYNLIIGTLLSVGLSAWALIPALIQTLTSYRFAGGFENPKVNVNFYHKCMLFFFYGLPILYYIKSLSSKHVNKINMKMINISLILSGIIPVFFERVNLMWHMGSYMQFPFRYGFIPLMILYLGALEFFRDNKEKEEKKKKKLDYKTIIIPILIAIPTIVGLIYNGIYINSHDPVFNYTDSKMFIITFITGVSTALFYYLAIKINSKKVKYTIIGIFTIITALSYTYGYLGISKDYKVEREHNDEAIFYSEELGKKINSNLYRVKNNTIKGFENNALISNVPESNSFVHIIGKNQILNNTQLGYAGYLTKLKGAGGTIFTDAILGVKYVVSKEKLSSNLYNEIDTLDGDYIYEYKNVLPFGILYDKEIKEIPEELKIFDANNYLYKNIFNKEDNIIETNKYTVNKNDEEKEYTINISGEKELYLYIEDDPINDDQLYTKGIYINDKLLAIPTMNDQNYTIYPTIGRNGIIDLGYFKDEEVNIKIKYHYNKNNTTEEKEILFGQLDINKYLDIFNNKHNIDVKLEKNKIYIDGNVNKDTNIMIPVIYNDGFKSDIEIKEVFNTFIGVPLKKGNNNITITFTPKMFKESCLVTIGTILLMILCFFIKKIFDIRNIKFIMIIFWIIGILILLFATYKIYLDPFIQTFIGIIKNGI